MSFDSYYSMVIRQQEVARTELLRADANAAQITRRIGRLRRTAARATRTLPQPVRFGGTMQLRRTR